MKSMMRGYVGDLMFFFDAGHAVGLTLYREWLSLGGCDLPEGIEIEISPATFEEAIRMVGITS